MHFDDEQVIGVSSRRLLFCAACKHLGAVTVFGRMAFDSLKIARTWRRAKTICGDDHVGARMASSLWPRNVPVQKVPNHRTDLVHVRLQRKVPRVEEADFCVGYIALEGFGACA